MAACDDTVDSVSVDSVEQLELDSGGKPGPSSYSTNSRPWLLDTLNCPELSVLARKRKGKTNPPVGAKRSQHRCSLLSQTYTLKSVLPAQHVRE